MATMHPALQPRYLQEFQCTGPQCPDNCCNRFTVMVDPATLHRYETMAPELLDVVTEKPGIGPVLAFDAHTGCCPKMSAGSCSIHADYGTDFLTDVCHLYPRITRQLGNTHVMAGTISCPEIARLALFGDGAFEMQPGHTDRIPFNIKNYLPQDMSADETVLLNSHIISLVEQSPTAEAALAKLAFVVMRFGHQPASQWLGTLNAGWTVMDAMLPAAQSDERDPFFLLIMLTTLLTAGKIKPSPRLAEVLQMMEHSLRCRMDADLATVDMEAGSMEALAAMMQAWQSHQRSMQPLLKHVVMAKLHAGLYPFAGLGETPQQRISWLIIHYATIRLGLMAHCAASGAVPAPDDSIKIVQTITRVLDHLGDLRLALPMMEEAGWLHTARLIGLLGYAPHAPLSQG